MSFRQSEKNVASTTSNTDLPLPSDPSPRCQEVQIEVKGRKVPVADDTYSDRIRCDHPSVADGVALGRSLLETARERDRGKVVVLAESKLRKGLESAGLEHEATIPGFYEGKKDCSIMGLPLDESRARPVDPEALENVDQLIRKPGLPRDRDLQPTEMAVPDDARAIASLIDDTFDHYPTPSGVPAYIEKQITDGTPFRVVRKDGVVVSCASADLVPEARTAELTDCATRPDQRGKGQMQAILSDLLDDLRAMDYPTAFTLVRATIPGVNLAFQRLGFEHRGLMTRSCRIGGGIEDMNVWSRFL